MTRFLLALSCAILIFSCKSGVPKDIIQPEEMEKVLFDIHLADGYVAYIPSPDSVKLVSAPLYKGIYKKYGIDSAQHAKSMSYYYKNPDVLSKIYDRIGAKLEKVKLAEEKDREKKLAAEAKRLKKVVNKAVDDNALPKEIKKVAVDTKTVQ